METVLAIAGCGPRLEIALTAPGLVAPAIVAASGPAPRSDVVVAAIDLLLRASGLGTDALGAVVASTGPGSFTGIRVALATALGLASSRGIAAHGFPSLVMQAARTAVRPCVAVQPARRGHVWAQMFADDGRIPVPAEEAAVVAIAELAHTDVPIVAPAGLDLPPGALRATAAITGAEALLALAALHRPLDPDTLVPTYLEAPQAAPPPRPSPSWLRSHRAS